MKHVIVGTAGHIDHGKSALVEALTGTHPDRLEEEKRRGITIDLGFAFLDLEGVRLGFVDVPGHERFVRNMLAGVGGIDLVLLVIAADESIKPQTREHFDICRLLGIHRGIVALTKLDLVSPDVAGLVKLEAEEFVRGSFLDGAPVVEVSARTGTGLDSLKQALLRVAQEVPEKDPARHFRLPIDRAFAMKGFGTIVTGTLVEGAVKPEDEVELFPARRRVRVRGIHSGGRAVTQAVAGQRTALNLAGVELDEIRRGMALATPGHFLPTKRLDARVQLLATARPMKNHSCVHFHQGAAEAVAEVVLLDGAQLAPGESALAQLRLDQALLVLPGDRFILRQFSPVITMGGGTVLDSLAKRHRAGDQRARVFLETLERGNREEILAALATAEPRGMELVQIIARTGWVEAEAKEAIRRLAEAGRLRILAGPPMMVMAEETMAALVRGLRESVENFHTANPLTPGISKEELRGHAASGARPEFFRAALEELVASRVIVVSGDMVQRAGREITLLPEEAQAKEQIERAFAAAGLTAPCLEEVLARLPIEAARARKILQILLREKTLVRITQELVFHQMAVARLRETLAGYRKQHGERLPIAAFKELTGVSRKYAIPLLEYLDRERVTRRVGDERVIL